MKFRSLFQEIESKQDQIRLIKGQIERLEDKEDSSGQRADVQKQLKDLYDQLAKLEKWALFRKLTTKISIYTLAKP